MSSSLSTLITNLRAILAAVCPDPTLAEQEAWWLLEHVTKTKKAQLIALDELALSSPQKEYLDKCLREHVQEKKPLQYIIGSVPFLDCVIQVAPPTLIPRCETEEWTDWLLTKITSTLGKQSIPPLTILDLCCGSGCIAIALARALPNATVVAADIHPNAIQLTKKNAVLNQCKNITVVQSDLFDELLSLKNSFDIIVSNPPYVSQEEWLSLDQSVRLWEDHDALVADEHGLALYKKIITQAPNYLKTDSVVLDTDIPRLVLEIGHTQGAAVQQLAQEAGFVDVLVHQDLEKKDRWVSALTQRSL